MGSTEQPQRDSDIYTQFICLLIVADSCSDIPSVADSSWSSLSRSCSSSERVFSCLVDKDCSCFTLKISCSCSADKQCVSLLEPRNFSRLVVSVGDIVSWGLALRLERAGFGGLIREGSVAE